MDEIELLRRYAARNDAAEPVRVDVVDDVLATLRRRRRDAGTAPSLRPLMAAAAASALVAASLGLAVQQSLSDLQDPLGALVSPFVVTLQ